MNAKHPRVAHPAAGTTNAGAADAAKMPLCFVVDREPWARQIISSVLRDMNIEVEGFETPDKMLAQYHKKRPQLIFFDVTVGGSEANGCLEMLQSAGVECPIHLISGLNGLLTEQLKRSWSRSGLKILSTVAKPLRQQLIKKMAYELKPTTDDRPKVSLLEVIDNGWLELWYQPRIDLRSKVFAGAEGFLRARHPKLGIIPASELLSGAADSELLTLTTRVLSRALGDWKSFRDIGVSIEFSINIPVCALKRLSLFSIFWEHGPNTSDWPGITLELSEDEIIPNMPFAFGAVKELHKQKISLAIDSFGLSYEELSRHDEIPFSMIKIDRSFICNCDQDPLNAGLCEMIIEFAHKFGASAVAEGVETPGELKALRRMGCDFAQGYLLARPMNKTEMISILRQRSAKSA